MSMISSLIDELNKSADEWNSSNMFELARMCRRAADTIWELRDDLQRANAESARLRDELESVGTAAYLYGRGDINAENDKLRKQGARLFDKTLELKDENTKLRELVRELYEIAQPEAPSMFEAEFADRMRELGAEVES